MRKKAVLLITHEGNQGRVEILITLSLGSIEVDLTVVVCDMFKVNQKIIEAMVSQC